MSSRDGQRAKKIEAMIGGGEEGHLHLLHPRPRFPEPAGSEHLPTHLQEQRGDGETHMLLDSRRRPGALETWGREALSQMHEARSGKVKLWKGDPRGNRLEAPRV